MAVFGGAIRTVAITVAVLAAVTRHAAAATSAISPAPIAAADAQVLADRPLAVWRFAEPDGSKQAVAERFAQDGNRSFPNDS
ncbi:hypothetical protein EBU58_13325, partial [bacterium]|nr:hypothetical protein [bacterium]